MGHGVEKKIEGERVDVATARQVAETMQALATPSRVLILARLKEGACSVGELAEAVGMDPTALNKAIAGKRRLNLNEIVSIASCLGVEPESLIAEEGPVFAMRAGNDDEAIDSAVEECSHVIEDFLTFESLVGRS